MRVINVRGKQMTIVLYHQGYDYTVEFRFDKEGEKASLYHVNEKYFHTDEDCFDVVDRPYVVMQGYVDEGWKPIHILVK